MNASDHCIALRPICSLTVRAASFFFGFVYMTSLGIAALMATQGFWPVLPFAGLEMLVLGWALAISLRNRHVVQRLAISDNEVRFDSLSAASVEHLVFPRQWTKVTLRAPHAVLHPSRLLIESHSRACEIGGFLNEQQRRRLAARLKQLM